MVFKILVICTAISAVIAEGGRGGGAQSYIQYQGRAEGGNWGGRGNDGGGRWEGNWGGNGNMGGGGGGGGGGREEGGNGRKWEGGNEGNWANGGGEERRWGKSWGGNGGGERREETNRNEGGWNRGGDEGGQGWNRGGGGDEGGRGWEGGQRWAGGDGGGGGHGAQSNINGNLKSYSNHKADQDEGLHQSHRPHYQFNYGVADKQTHDRHEQQEKRDGDRVEGYYSLDEPDGTVRIVHYTADHKNGWNARVERRGHAVHPEANNRGHGRE
ncbi:adult-specific cuticular protein ACP-22-like [Onthophagus taurus]|uniref:adult-specific cuticular protein ACP-22-like n=1 Tax=Onthophagus taurus TaxID=166361 RepID=UPI0039BEC90C